MAFSCAKGPRWHSVPAVRRRAFLLAKAIRQGRVDGLPPEHVVYDSTTERDFADALKRNNDVVLDTKLPGWFKVPTSLGSYNPDWALLIERDGTQRLYFVVGTKSNLFTDDLRGKKSAKIEFGKAHFQALGVGENPARYVAAKTINEVQNTTS